MNLTICREYINYFDKYFNHYKEIYEKYKRYGNIVLEVDLTNEEFEEKQIILKATNLAKLEDTLRTYWQNTYACVISNCKDIKNAVLHGSIGHKIFLCNHNNTKFIRNYRFEVSEDFIRTLINHCNSCKDYVVSTIKNQMQTVEMDIIATDMLCRIKATLYDRSPEKINSYIEILSSVNLSSIYKD